MSASDVLTTFTSRSVSLMLSRRAGEQIVRDGEFDEIDVLALDIGKARLVLQDDGVIAVRDSRRR